MQKSLLECVLEFGRVSRMTRYGCFRLALIIYSHINDIMTCTLVFIPEPILTLY